MKTNEKEKLFNTVFEKMDLPDDIKKTFENTIVQKVEIHKNDRSLEVNLKDSNNFDNKTINKLKSILLKEFGQLKDVIININLENKNTNEDLQKKTSSSSKKIKKLNFSQEQYNKAINTDLANFLMSKGYNLMRKGKEFCLKEHDSLVLSNNEWFWHSKGVGGSPVQFLQIYENKSFVEAIIELSEFDGYSYNKSELEYVEPVKNTPDYGKFELPVKNENNSRVFSYLTKTRGIHPHIVNSMVKHNLLYESDKHNCVFIGYDNENKPHYASLRGTISDTNIKAFKQDVPNSNKDYGFKVINNPDNRKIYVLESPIDIMSFMTLLKKHDLEFKKYNFLSLGGLSDRSLNRFLEDNPNFNKIVFCLDNDVDGKDKDGNPYNHGQEKVKKLTKKYSEKGYICSSHKPKLKDYNEDLIALSYPDKMLNMITKEDELEL